MHVNFSFRALQKAVSDAEQFQGMYALTKQKRMGQVLSEKLVQFWLKGSS
jgi:hypothetical protein